MSVEKGQLSIHTENFLPIIKKWLYSDRDIFVRELVSNCCDAVAKRRMTGETPEDYSPRVTVRVDKEHRILSFTDDGVGMTPEQLETILDKKESDAESTKIGVYNVNERLQLFFGPDAVMKYYSTPGVRTMVMLVLPIVREKEEDSHAED